MIALPSPLDRPTLNLWPEVGELLGLSRASVYAAAARGEIPTLRFGRSLRVPTAELRRLLGLEDASSRGSGPGSDAAASSSLTVDPLTTEDRHGDNT